MAHARLTLSDLARVAHEAVRALQLCQGDPDAQLSWEKAPEWSRGHTRNRVAILLAGESAEEWHEDWVNLQLRAGWTWGPEHDAVVKTDPRLVPYARLDRALVAQDVVLASVVDGLAEFLV